MLIAVIGWGSLIWCPGCLRIKIPWHGDGPALPIEFARISDDKRLTLVLHPGSVDQVTYWAVSELETLEDARENLRIREGTSSKCIHSLTSDGQTEGEIDLTVAASIREWLAGRKGIQAVVWTGLLSNWPQKRNNKQFTTEDAVAYVRELESERDQANTAYNRAREYVTNTPPQIQTPVRKIIGQRKGWKDAKLPTALFERS